MLDLSKEHIFIDEKVDPENGRKTFTYKVTFCAQFVQNFPLFDEDDAKSEFLKQFKAHLKSYLYGEVLDHLHRVELNAVSREQTYELIKKITEL